MRLGIDAAARRGEDRSERAAARAAKDFARADEIRKALREQRIELMDGAARDDLARGRRASSAGGCPPELMRGRARGPSQGPRAREA